MGRETTTIRMEEDADTTTAREEGRGRTMRTTAKGTASRAVDGGSRSKRAVEEEEGVMDTDPTGGWLRDEVLWPRIFPNCRGGEWNWAEGVRSDGGCR